MAEKELTAKSGWRPAAGWVYLVLSSCIVATICYLLIIKATTLAEASTVLSMIVGSYGGIVGLYVHNRTKEKIADKHEDSHD